MATKIRLKRIGRRNRPFYRMVAMDSRNRRDGAAIEELGWYNPIDTEHSYDLKDDRILHWLGEGAQPTDAAKKLLRRAGLSHRWHLMQQGLEESELDKEMKKWELNREDVLKGRAARDEEKAKEKEKKVKEAASFEEEKSDAPQEKAIANDSSAEVSKEVASDDVSDDASTSDEETKKEEPVNEEAGQADDSSPDDATMEEE